MGADVGALLAALAERARREPPVPGVVYRHRDPAGVVLYVGSTDVQHEGERQAEHARSAAWWAYVATIERVEVADRRAAFDAERTAIRAGESIFNYRGRKDAEGWLARRRRYLASARPVRGRRERL